MPGQLTTTMVVVLVSFCSLVYSVAAISIGVGLDVTPITQSLGYFGIQTSIAQSVVSQYFTSITASSTGTQIVSAWLTTRTIQRQLMTLPLGLHGYTVKSHR